MKSWMKKLLAMITVVIMMLGLLPVSAMATEEPSPDPILATGDATLTINAPATIPGTDITNTSTFKIYKIASMNQEVVDGTVKVTYTPEAGYEAIMTAVLANPGSEDVVKTQALAAEVIAAGKTPVVDSIGINTRTASLPYGYYLVVPATAPAGVEPGVPIMVAVPNPLSNGWKMNVEVTAKAGYSQPTKDIVLANGDKVKTNTIQPGDIITYEVTVQMPNFFKTNSKGIVITDTMSTGLAYKDGSIKVYADTVAEKNEIALDDGEFTVAEAKHSFTIQISNATKLNAIKGKKLIIRYDATVEDTITVSKVEINEVDVTIEENELPPPTPPKSYTFAIQINKTGSDQAKLEGVRFELYDKAPGESGREPIAEGTSNKDGIITFDKLLAEYNEGKGTEYWLKEVETNTGYTLLANEIKVTLIPTMTNDGEYDGNLTYKINDVLATTSGEAGEAALVVSNRTAEVDVINNKGFALPSTGGMGTYLFTIGGIVIMAAALIVLFALRKKDRA